MVVEVSRRDEAALITLNRPKALNALSFEILDELDAACAMPKKAWLHSRRQESLPSPTTEWIVSSPLVQEHS